MRALRLLVGLLVGLLLALALASSATAKAYPPRPTGFPNGETIEGWQWLRKLDHSATVDLRPGGAAERICASRRQRLAEPTPLITNGLNGVAGCHGDPGDAHVHDATRPEGDQGLRRHEKFQAAGSEYSGGIGYQCYGQSLLPWSKWKGATGRSGG
jgi:hypothetical protein